MSERSGPFRLLVRPDDIPRSAHDEACRMICAALAEAGYPTAPRWTVDRYVQRPGVPDEVLWKARRLVCDRLGLPYEDIPVGSSSAS